MTRLFAFEAVVVVKAAANVYRLSALVLRLVVISFFTAQRVESSFYWFTVTAAAHFCVCVVTLLSTFAADSVCLYLAKDIGTLVLWRSEGGWVREAVL